MDLNVTVIWRWIPAGNDLKCNNTAKLMKHFYYLCCFVTQGMHACHNLPLSNCPLIIHIISSVLLQAAICLDFKMKLKAGASHL